MVVQVDSTPSGMGQDEGRGLKQQQQHLHPKETLGCGVWGTRYCNGAPNQACSRRRLGELNLYGFLAKLHILPTPAAPSFLHHHSACPSPSGRCTERAGSGRRATAAAQKGRGRRHHQLLLSKEKPLLFLLNLQGLSLFCSLYFESEKK